CRRSMSASETEGNVGVSRDPIDFLNKSGFATTMTPPTTMASSKKMTTGSGERLREGAGGSCGGFQLGRGVAVGRLKECGPERFCPASGAVAPEMLLTFFGSDFCAPVGVVGAPGREGRAWGDVSGSSVSSLGVGVPS